MCLQVVTFFFLLFLSFFCLTVQLLIKVHMESDLGLGLVSLHIKRDQTIQIIT